MGTLYHLVITLFVTFHVKLGEKYLGITLPTLASQKCKRMYKATTLIRDSLPFFWGKQQANHTHNGWRRFGSGSCSYSMKQSSICWPSLIRSERLALNSSRRKVVEVEAAVVVAKAEMTKDSEWTDVWMYLQNSIFTDILQTARRYSEVHIVWSGLACVNALQSNASQFYSRSSSLQLPIDLGEFVLSKNPVLRMSKTDW